MFAATTMAAAMMANIPTTFSIPDRQLSVLNDNVSYLGRPDYCRDNPGIKRILYWLILVFVFPYRLAGQSVFGPDVVSDPSLYDLLNAVIKRK